MPGGWGLGAFEIVKGLAKHSRLARRHGLYEANQRGVGVAVGDQGLMHELGRMVSSGSNGGEPYRPSVQPSAH